MGLWHDSLAGQLSTDRLALSLTAVAPCWGSDFTLSCGYGVALALETASLPVDAARSTLACPFGRQGWLVRNTGTSPSVISMYPLTASNVVVKPVLVPRVSGGAMAVAKSE